MSSTKLKLLSFLMIKKEKTTLVEKLAQVVVHGMQEKKAHDITLLDLRNIGSSVSDFFVVCHANSPLQVDAIAKSVEEEVFKAFSQEPWRKEGLTQGEWVVLDYVDVVVHIFIAEKRDYYGIEDLWADAELIDIKSA